MGVIRKFLGPKSKYDINLPYTYLAKVPIIENNTDLFSYYFSDTICGLIEHLYNEKILSSEAQLYGLYRKEEIELDKSICCDENGNWLMRPELCKKLEEYYESSKDILYKGHKEVEECSFDDRDRVGEGPF